MSASQINQFNEEEIKVNTEKKKTGKVKKIVLGVVVLFEIGRASGRERVWSRV